MMTRPEGKVSALRIEPEAGEDALRSGLRGAGFGEQAGGDGEGH